MIRQLNKFLQGVKTFSATLRAQQDVIVPGTVDGIDISDLSAEVVTLSTVQEISGTKVCSCISHNTKVNK